MSIGDSIIRVTILGDAKKLIGALGDADKATDGLLKSSAKAIGGALLVGVGVNEAFGFLKDSTQEADRLGDAVARLNIQIGETDTDKLEATAGSFHDIGASSQDILELEANFADLATKAGLSDQAITDNAEHVATLAFAISQLEDVDPATVVEQIGKAADGSSKAYAFLGVNIDEANVKALALTQTGKTLASSLTDGELAAARLTLVMEQLDPKLKAVTEGSGDLEKQQRQLDATVEELQAKLGGPLSDALAAVVGFINDEIDAIPGAIAGFELLGQTVVEFGKTALTPLARVNDVLNNISDLLSSTAFNLTHLGQNTSQSVGSEANANAARDNYNLRNGQGRP